MKFKKKTFFLSLLLLSFNGNAKTNSCILDDFFMKSDNYRSVILDINNNELEKTNNMYSLLPDVYITSGQSAYNNSGFKHPTYNSAALSISQSIYSGGGYLKNKEKLNLNTEGYKRTISENRLLYMLEVYSNILMIRNNEQLIDFYKKRLINQETEQGKLMTLFTQGDIPEVEMKLGLEDIRTYKDNILRLELEKKNLELKIQEKYKIPLILFKKITKNTLISCKRESFLSLIQKENILNKKGVILDHEIEKSYYYPTVSLSFNLTPKKDGMLRDLSFSEGRYIASVNVNIPVSGLFKLTTINDKFKSSIEQLNYKIDLKLAELQQKKRELEFNVEVATQELKNLKEKIKIRQNQLFYMKSNLITNDEMNYSYHNEKEKIQHLENLMSIKESEIEINKMHLYYID